MTALALLQQLYTLRMVLTPYPDGTLRYKAPKGVLTPQLLDAMRQHKVALLAMLTPERPYPAPALPCAVLAMQRPE